MAENNNLGVKVYLNADIKVRRRYNNQRVGNKNEESTKLRGKTSGKNFSHQEMWLKLKK